MLLALIIIGIMCVVLAVWIEEDARWARVWIIVLMLVILTGGILSLLNLI